MIEPIVNIGRTVREIDGEQQLIDLWQKDERGTYELTLFVNINNGKIDLDIKAFEKKVFQDGLFYQQGNWSIGSLIKIDNFKNTKENQNKIKNKILKALEFLELPLDVLPNEVNDMVFSRISEYEGTSFVILFTKDGQLPIDFLKHKFIEAIEEVGLKRKKNCSGICQMCNTQSNELYDSVVYKCFTNDKEIYSNTDALSYGICRECIYDILYGKRHIDSYLKIWWSGSEVLFLPHEYNVYMKNLFETYSITDSNSTSFLSNLRENETDVLEEIGNCGALVDILFIYDNKSSSEWKITSHIRNVMPSRFTKIADLEIKYKGKNGTPLTFYHIIRYLVSEGIDETEMFKTGEAKNFLKDIFYGNKINRTLFFNRVMQNYQSYYYNGKKKPSLILIHRIYNFLVDCGCLDNGWNLMIRKNGDYTMDEYEDVSDFFVKNKDFFSNNVKKAWFLLGRLYSKMIYESKVYKAGDNNKNVESHLEKNFFFGRKYDFNTFVYLSNQCSELMHKYGVQNKKYLKDLAAESKELMGLGNEKIGTDEAKYIFFWGMQQWIGKLKDDNKIDEGDDE